MNEPRLSLEAVERIARATWPAWCIADLSGAVRIVRRVLDGAPVGHEVTHAEARRIRSLASELGPRLPAARRVRRLQETA
jgi:hypothetical protein